MKQTTETAMLPFKVLEVAEIIAEKKRLSLADALFYLYNSELYAALSDAQKKLWYNGARQLYELLEEEKSRRRPSAAERAEKLFLVFCIEQYRLRENMASAAVLALFSRLGADKFLTENFEVLHSQSADYILREIDVFIKKRR